MGAVIEDEVAVVLDCDAGVRAEPLPQRAPGARIPHHRVPVHHLQRPVQFESEPRGRLRPDSSGLCGAQHTPIRVDHHLRDRGREVTRAAQR